MSDREVAVVVGAGTGLGAALVRCFAGAGLDVTVAARDPERLEDVTAGGQASVGKVRAYPCDATDEKAVENLFESVTAEFGEPALVVYNAGAFVRASILEIEAADFERCWRVGCLGGFLVGRASARRMVSRGSGTVIFTGATASLRGSAMFANLAVGKFGLRALAQSMARELGPKGVHVAHVVVDGMIATPRAGGQTETESRLDPAAIADDYLALHRQPRSAWTLELDLRPWVEQF